MAIVNSYDRVVKYMAKTQPDRVGRVVDLIKSTALGNFITGAADMDRITQLTKTAIEGLGSPVALHWLFIGFAKQLRSTANKYSGLTLQDLAQAFKDTWEDRGGNNATLIATAQVQGITVV